MESMYLVLKCQKCKKEMILLREDVSSIHYDAYLSCAYCNSLKLTVNRSLDVLKDYDKARVYKRYGRRLRQVNKK